MRAPPIRAAAPLRFLFLVAGLWICARAAILAPGWRDGNAATNAAPLPGATTAIERPALATGPVPIEAAAPRPSETGSAAPASLIRDVSYKGAWRGPAGFSPAAGSSTPGAVPAASVSSSSHPVITSSSPFPPPPLVSSAGGRPGRAFAAPAPRADAARFGDGARFLRPRTGAVSSRWSASAWLLVRGDQGGAALAAGGTLGGSQAGARISYRLGGALSLSARAYLPLRRTAGAEAAAGFEWRPLPQVPLSIIAERRQALGRAGRSAFAVNVHGGVSRALPRRLRLDAYAQAGVVGVRARDPFADGAVRVSAPIGPVEIGAAAWGAAQPGAARLDAGPALGYRLPVRGLNLRIEAGWRFRVAGDAAPRSGPALSLGTDF